jgi:hypothetical protein
MRVYSYLFHAIVAFFLCFVSIVAILNGRNLQLDLLPFQGKTLTIVMLVGGLIGGLSVVLAFWGRVKILLLIWSVVVLLFMVKGYIFSPYYFGGTRNFLNALLFLFAAALAVLGAWLRYRQKPSERMI